MSYYYPGVRFTLEVDKFSANETIDRIDLFLNKTVNFQILWEDKERSFKASIKL